MFIKLNIGTKLMGVTTLLVTLAVAMTSIAIGILVYRTEKANAQEVAKATAGHFATAIKSMLEVAMDEGRAFAHLLEAAMNSDQVHLNRQEVLTMAKYFIEKKPNFLGISLIFEPNAFGELDEDFVNAPGHDATGRFVPYWTRTTNGVATLSALTDYATENFYLIPKQRQRESIIEPYFYLVQGKNVLMTSMMIPIFSKTNELLGMVGIDTDTATVQQRVDEIKFSQFTGAWITIYSDKGFVVASQEYPDKLGINIDELSDDLTFIKAILADESFLLERTVKYKGTTVDAGETVISYGYSIEIGYSGTYWSSVVNIPIKDLTAKAVTIVTLITLIGFVVIIIALFFSYFVARNLATPLIQINQQLKILAQGQISEETIAYRSHDEIKEIISSLYYLRQRMKSTIEQTKAIATGHFTENVQLLSDQDQLGIALADMTGKLREATMKNTLQDWLKNGQMLLNAKMSGEQDIIVLTKNIISFLAHYVEAQIGLFYLLQETEETAYLHLIASYAYIHTHHDNHPIRFKIGEGTVGEVALEKQTVYRTQTSEECTFVTQSGLTQAAPRSVIVVPILHEEVVKGVLELGKFEAFTEVQREFLEQVAPTIGVAVSTVQSRIQTRGISDQK